MAPNDPHVLLGASGGLVGTRTYTSTHDGDTWRSAADVPNTLLGDRPLGDPVPAIDAEGHEYVAFVAASPSSSSLYCGLVTRDGPDGDWQPTNRPIVDDHFQDKPMLAVDNAPASPHPGRLYLGGAEFRVGRSLATLVLTHSDDRGQTVSGRGDRRGVTATPLLRVDTSEEPFAGRVYLDYEDRRNERTNTYVLRLTPELRPIGRPIPALRPSRTADRFLPAIDVDETNGDVRGCFYATDGGGDHLHVRYSCVASGDGGASWSRVARAASQFSRVTRRTADVSFGYGDYEGVARGRRGAPDVDRCPPGSNGSEVFSATLAAR